MRCLTNIEREILLDLAEQVGSDAERAQLIADLNNCVVEDAASDGSRIIFHIEGFNRPTYRGQDTFRGKDKFPIGGVVLDKDGEEMGVALYIAFERIYELELVRHVGGSVLGPDWSSFKLK